MILRMRMKLYLGVASRGVQRKDQGLSFLSILLSHGSHNLLHLHFHLPFPPPTCLTDDSKWHSQFPSLYYMADPAFTFNSQCPLFPHSHLIGPTHTFVQGQKLTIMCTKCFRTGVNPSLIIGGLTEKRQCLMVSWTLKEGYSQRFPLEE